MMIAKSNLAQYACDHCKQRKLRCSREFPSCQNCTNSWGVDCKYSRHGKIPRRPRKNVGVRARNGGDDQLNQSNISPVPKEESSSLTGKDDKLNAKENENVQIPDTKRNIQQDSQGKLLSDNIGKQFYLGPSPAATFIFEANKSISKLTSAFSDTSLKANAEEGLSELSDYLASRDFSYASDIRKSVREFRRNNEVFFIPTEEEGEQLLQIFSHGIEKGQPFFTPPPPNIIRKLAFEPSQVRERGWLLLFNSFVSTAASLIKPPNQRLCRGLQWNTWLLLEDSSILLEPSEVTIQALLLVATHGQDITTPSLCLTLISHACHMTQALALHLPTRRSPPTSEENKHRNCLFWSIFSVDKALALSFGRQPLLPSYLFKNVPLPDPLYLAKYRPHFDDNLPASQTNRIYEEFGSFHFIKYLDLAMIHGEISDLLQFEPGVSRGKVLEIKKKLDKWMEDVEESKYAKVLLLQDPEQVEVSIGLNYMKFQYHHLIVYLTRGGKEDHHLCLSSARAAISMLENLVSSSNQVYNGIVWQLLYQPFTPFFVLFTSILADPQSKSCFADLQLLRRVVLYFLQMHNNHPSAPKLEKVADTFTRLAEAYVRHSMQTSRSPDPSPSNLATMHQDVNTSVTQSSLPDLLTDDISSNFSSLPSTTVLGQGLDFDSNLLDSTTDPMALLNFFSTADINMEGFSENFALESEAPMMQKLNDFGQNYGLDTTFDWISWDQYDSSIS